jgi:5-methylcytosine-specific restriction endonuclease McrA
MDKIQASRKRTYDKKGRRSTENKRLRGSKQYFDWRKAIYERDNYTCQDCKARGGKGNPVELHPHHIKPFATYPDHRFDIANGVTLCANCHQKRHKHIFIPKKRHN